MYHFTYKVSLKNSEKYYVGRHSTNNLNDNYYGSGKWVRSIRNKSNLIVEIISFYDSIEELKYAEEELLKYHIDNINNMNFNNKSCGFASGKHNVAFSEAEIERRKKYNWMKTSEGRLWASVNNCSKKESVREKRRDFAKKQLDMGIHNFQNEEVREKVKIIAKKRFEENNPMKSDFLREKFSKLSKKQLDMGIHNFQDEDNRKKANEINKKRMVNNNPMKNPFVSSKFKKPKEKVKCPYCGKEGGKPVMNRYHFDKCKSKNLPNF